MTNESERIIGENDFMEVVQVLKFRNDRNQEMASLKFMADPRADMARDLLRAWGMVSGFRGADDAAGRASLELMSVPDVVARAFEITDAAYAEMGRRGWLVKLERPSGADAAEQRHEGN